MTGRILSLVALAILWGSLVGVTQGQQERPKVAAAPRISSLELARWIDERLAAEWRAQGSEPPPIIDDATFMRRVYLDLIGTIPSVPQVRDFLNQTGTFKREDLVDVLLHAAQRPERYSGRSAEHLARVWRRVMIPKGSPNAAAAPNFDPWLREQFAANVAYDEFARRLLSGTTVASASPEAFFQAVGETPVNMANSLTRFFLGIRIGCAQCHAHPFNDWQQEDFWGMAAFFSPEAEGQPPSIRDEGGVSYKPRFLWGGPPDFTQGKPAREVLADWMVSPDNPNFAAVAVNRIWQHLCGRGLVAGVDDLDQVTPEEREVLDELAGMFSESGFNLQWLIEGICKSKFYQRSSMSTAPGSDEQMTALRPLKTLTPEQVFDSLEQALSLPIGRVDNPPRHNGLRNAFVARMDEAASESPEEFRAGIPQALMIMNGTLTAAATDLEKSHTLRAVVDAPFLKADEKIEVMYLATFTRPPTDSEVAFLLKHVEGQPNLTKRRQAYAEVFWGILNSPEFVLSR